MRSSLYSRRGPGRYVAVHECCMQCIVSAQALQSHNEICTGDVWSLAGHEAAGFQAGQHTEQGQQQCSVCCHGSSVRAG